jgi:hypothetical protein
MHILVPTTVVTNMRKTMGARRYRDYCQKHEVRFLRSSKFTSPITVNSFTSLRTYATDWTSHRSTQWNIHLPPPALMPYPMHARVCWAMLLLTNFHLGPRSSLLSLDEFFFLKVTLSEKMMGDPISSVTTTVLQSIWLFHCILVRWKFQLNSLVKSWNLDRYNDLYTDI